MVSDTMLMPMLVAAFAVAGMQFLAVFARSSGAVEYFWLGTACLAAAGGALAHCANFDEAAASDPFLAQDLPKLFAAAWMIASAWCIVEYSFGGSGRRWSALAATLLIVVACFSDIGLDGGEQELAPGPSPRRLVDLGALAIVLVLAMDAAFRLWTSARRGRAAAMTALCLAVAIAAAHDVLHGFSELAPSVLFAFLLVIMVTTYVLAGTVVDGEALARRERLDPANAPRLSIVGELTASIAHEINQPLGAILNNADAGELLVANPNPPLDEIRQIFVDIRRDGMRASDVIGQVRKLVRKRELEFERLDANAVATEVIALLGGEARSQRISITPLLWPRPAYLHGDRVLIEQMLINLITNAMDSIKSIGTAGEPSSPAPGLALAVSSTRHGDIEFQVIDTGTGIPVERLDHLFNSFYTSKAHGMGLGLSISRSIVEAHGGRIRAENNSDRGATFRATFPAFLEDVRA